ncbi:uncharacterized protein AMSG_02995 [Thecamonas trahens ATCC 50062]|uniref:Domain of unknown function at the cortex 1 domain-containing protein n=1 Tax=Thecamonas trahens ATCC 50062 TaxID=461836 RepID=A0A0L0D2N4_THETB|nr:hypothetical protein AMSG_02995 [Thecamonas trahens ATCC 50062]KNC46559.1 hypothetical protein AMSG_02995 [Thecamonas trahens ATCC 50062]|eukprot:XP_013760338.1 hypothetical protein AMSG_02995 [Thecamonas trahens ATCC 50062]
MDSPVQQLHLRGVRRRHVGTDGSADILSHGWLVHQVATKFKRIIIFLGVIFTLVGAHLLITSLLSRPPTWLQGELLTFTQSLLILSVVSFLIVLVCAMKYHQRTQERFASLLEEQQRADARLQSARRVTTGSAAAAQAGDGVELEARLDSGRKPATTSLLPPGMRGAAHYYDQAYEVTMVGDEYVFYDGSTEYVLDLQPVIPAAKAKAMKGPPPLVDTRRARSSSIASMAGFRKEDTPGDRVKSPLSPHSCVRVPIGITELEHDLNETKRLVFMHILAHSRDSACATATPGRRARAASVASFKGKEESDSSDPEDAIEEGPSDATGVSGDSGPIDDSLVHMMESWLLDDLKTWQRRAAKLQASRSQTGEVDSGVQFCAYPDDELYSDECESTGRGGSGGSTGNADGDDDNDADNGDLVVNTSFRSARSGEWPLNASSPAFLTPQVAIEADDANGDGGDHITPLPGRPPRRIGAQSRSGRGRKDSMYYDAEPSLTGARLTPHGSSGSSLTVRSRRRRKHRRRNEQDDEKRQSHNFNDTLSDWGESWTGDEFHSIDDLLASAGATPAHPDEVAFANNFVAAEPDSESTDESASRGAGEQVGRSRAQARARKPAQTTPPARTSASLPSVASSALSSGSGDGWFGKSSVSSEPRSDAGESVASASGAASPVADASAEIQAVALENIPPLWHGPLRVTLLGVCDMALNTPVPFENEHFKGTIMLRLRNAIDADPDDPYFEGKSRVFAIEVDGSFKNNVNGNDVLYGAAFEAPIVFPRGFSLAVRCASAVDPGLRIEWKTDTPSFLSPLLCSMNEIHGPGMPDELSVEQRRKYFKTEANRAAFEFKTDASYSFRIYGNVMDWAQFNAKLGPFKVNALGYLNKQPITLQASSPSTGAVYFGLRFYHKGLDPTAWPDYAP